MIIFSNIIYFLYLYIFLEIILKNEKKMLRIGLRDPNSQHKKLIFFSKSRLNLSFLNPNLYHE